MERVPVFLKYTRATSLLNARVSQKDMVLKQIQTPVISKSHLKSSHRSIDDIDTHPLREDKDTRMKTGIAHET